MFEFYVRSEIFCSLLLPVRLPPSLSYSKLVKFQAHAREEEIGELTELDWASRAREKLALPRSVATAIFSLTRRYLTRLNIVTSDCLAPDFLLLALFLQFYNSDSLRLKRSQSAERLSLETWPKPFPTSPSTPHRDLRDNSQPLSTVTSTSHRDLRDYSQPLSTVTSTSHRDLRDNSQPLSTVTSTSHRDLRDNSQLLSTSTSHRDLRDKSLRRARSKQTEEELHLQFFVRRMEEFSNLFISTSSSRDCCRILNLVFSVMKARKSETTVEDGEGSEIRHQGGTNTEHEGPVAAEERIRAGEPVTKIPARFEDVLSAANCKFVLTSSVKSKLMKKITANLSTSLHGILACIMSGKRISWELGFGGDGEKSKEKPKMATNAHLAGAPKLIVINQLIHRTLARRSSTVKDSNVKIHRCRHCYLYLVSTLQSLTLTKCSNTTVITGPVSGVVRVTGCRNIKLVTTAAHVIIKETVDSVVHANTTHPILIDGDSCSSLSLAPYSVDYDLLDEDLKHCGIENVAFHADPIVLLSDGLGISFRHSSSSVFHVRPEDFAETCLPFKTVSCTKNRMMNYPPEFKVWLDRKRNKVEERRQLIGAGNLSEPEKEILESRVREEFHRWVSSSSSRVAELRGLHSLQQILLNPRD